MVTGSQDHGDDPAAGFTKETSSMQIVHGSPSSMISSTILTCSGGSLAPLNRVGDGMAVNGTTAHVSSWEHPPDRERGTTHLTGRVRHISVTGETQAGRQQSAGAGVR